MFGREPPVTVFNAQAGVRFTCNTFSCPHFFSMAVYTGVGRELLRAARGNMSLEKGKRGQIKGKRGQIYFFIKK
jgi:hypothetical protein